VNGKERCMPFGVPVVWRVPSNTTVLSPISVWCPLFKVVMSMKNKSALLYPNIPSEFRPVPHGVGHLVPEPPGNFAMYCEDEESVSSNSEEQQPSVSRDADYLPRTHFSNHKITEGELSDLIRDLELPKNKAKLLA